MAALPPGHLANMGPGFPCTQLANKGKGCSLLLPYDYCDVGPASTWLSFRQHIKLWLRSNMQAKLLLARYQRCCGKQKSLSPKTAT